MKLWHRKKISLILLLFFLLVYARMSGFSEETKKYGPDPERNLINGEVTRLIKGAEEDEVVLPLKLALGIALANNLDIQIEKVRIPISEKTIVEQQARFD